MLKLALFCLSLGLAAGADASDSANVFSDHEVAQTYTLGEVDDRPKPVEQAEPEFSREHRGLTGTVRVGFVIDESGNVLNPRVAESNNRELDELATKTVAKWKFKAAKKSGEAVPVRVIVPMRFK